MSAEAADREAVSGSRPCTPPQASWFEFLLDPSLLEQHLQGRHPAPPPPGLLFQVNLKSHKAMPEHWGNYFFAQPNSTYIWTWIFLMKCGYSRNYILSDFLFLSFCLIDSLTIPVLNMLLNELLCASRVPPGVKHVDLDLSTLPPTTAMAVLIYNRWSVAIRTIVLSSFPEKQTKPGPHQLNMMSLVQQEKELTDNILSVLREQAADSITVLEGALNIKKDFYIHTLRTLDLLAADPSTANGETESSTAGLRISADHLHCQVHYDLGGIHFQQGCSDPSVYEKAREHFRMARELLTKLDSSASLCCVDEQRLAGYWSACKTLTEASDPSESQLTPYGQISCFMRNHDYGALIEAFIRDNVTLSLPNSFRHSIQLELLHKLQQGDRSLEEVCHKLCVCNAVRDALEGGVLSVSFHQLLLKPSKNTISFLLEVCTRSLDKEHRSETSKRKMAIFIKTVCNRLEDVSLAFTVSSHKLFMELLHDEEKKILMEQMRKTSATVNLSAKQLPSFYDIPASASVNISQLEQQLILSLDPRHIRQILIELHGMAERPFWRVNSKWEVPVDYVNVILAIKDNLTRDLVYILMAKGLHCISIKDFAHARQLFTACLELVTEFSPKLRQVMLNELLLMEVRGHEAGAAEGNMERPPPDLVSRVRGYLEMRIHDLPLRQTVGEECVVFMLNWRENEYLTLQVPQSLVNSNPYIKLGQLIASTCKELPGPKESRRTAKELWEVVVQICSVSSQHKRSSDGRVSLLKQRESSLVNEVTAEHISIWPSSLANLQSVDVEAVVVTLKELVNYALSLNPNNQSWLCTQADIYFVTNQYSAAMHYYLQAGTVCSDYFTKPVPPDVYTDQVAVLCQFLREVDYMTAFKALQEQNSHDSMDSFYDYIWDVTILEYLTYIHHKRGESDKRQVAIKAIGQTELNSSNPEEVLQLAAQKRKKKFLQALAKLYF
uniref:Integrator complex subunit 8-like n=1 Tax=Sinocyclocheilus grahami TaxID=75366 RepID=A0A672MRL8_SINGR